MTLRFPTKTRQDAARRPFHAGTRTLTVLVAFVTTGCATVQHSEPALVPSKYQASTGPFAVFANAPIAADMQVVGDLQALERDIEANLGLRVDGATPSVEVYILNDRDAFNHFLTFYYPELPPRRAFFLAQGSRRVIYTYYNDRLHEDLRHEATHALLNVAVGDLPLWLDEGLAEYFEGTTGRNADHLDRIPDDQKAGWKPDLARLETVKSVREMTPRDYRESWAWVHYLLNGPTSGKRALLSYLTEPHTPQDAPSLAERLARVDASADQVLLTHVDRLRSTPPTPLAAKPPENANVIHFQDAPLEAVVPPPPRPGLFNRFLGLFGLR